MSLAYAPNNLIAYAGNGRVRLGWNQESQPGMLGVTYTVYRTLFGQTPVPGTTAPLATGVLTNIFTDFLAVNGTSYTYLITATWPVNSGGDGVESAGNEVQATPAAVTVSLWPFEQTLKYLLAWLVKTDVVPAINAGLAQYGSDNPPSPLAATEVITGDKRAFSEPVICVVTRQGSDAYYCMGGLMLEIGTQIILKVPRAGVDSFPEDYDLVGSLFVDACRDLFNQSVNTILPSQDPATGLWLLPGQTPFTDCRITGSVRIDSLKSAEGVTDAVCWTVFHHAMLTYPLARPRALGQSQ